MQKQIRVFFKLMDGVIITTKKIRKMNSLLFDHYFVFFIWLTKKYLFSEFIMNFGIIIKRFTK